jgi:hypothetical protein
MAEKDFSSKISILALGPSILLFNGHWSSFIRVKRPERLVKHWPSYNAEVKNEWSYTLLPSICLHGKDRDNFTFI